MRATTHATEQDPLGQCFPCGAAHALALAPLGKLFQDLDGVGAKDLGQVGKLRRSRGLCTNRFGGIASRMITRHVNKLSVQSKEAASLDKDRPTRRASIEQLDPIRFVDPVCTKLWPQGSVAIGGLYKVCRFAPAHHADRFCLVNDLLGWSLN